MGATRKNLARKRANQVRRTAEIRSGYRDTSEIMGIDNLVARLPKRVTEWLHRLPVPKPIVIPGPDAATHPAATTIQNSLREALAGNFEIEGHPYPIADFLTFPFALRSCFATMRHKFKDAEQELGRQGEALVNQFIEQAMPIALADLNHEVMLRIWKRSRIDQELPSASLELQPSPSGRQRMVLSFMFAAPRELRVEIDGQARKAFQCAGQRGLYAPLTWLSCPASILAPAEPERDLPVYVQSHALRRLEERLAALGPDCAHFWMFESLREPRITARSADTLEFEYRVFDHRLGYLRARRVGDAVVVTTFVFLTMHGTPESRLLHEKLRLHRTDITYQALDRLETFAATDVLDDPDLAAIFKECGCGHLKEVRHLIDTPQGPYADNLRKYLRLNEPHHRNAIAQRLGLTLDTPTIPAQPNDPPVPSSVQPSEFG